MHTGMLIVARDIAHAKLLERLEAEGELPQYMRDHTVYCAGPAKTPEGSGHASGSFAQTAAGRMDSWMRSRLRAARCLPCFWRNRILLTKLEI